MHAALALLATLSAGTGSPVELSQPPPAPPPQPAQPHESAPPEPGPGESFDGREAVGVGAGRTALKVVAAPLRAAAWLVLTPLDHLVGWIERHKVPEHVFEALTSDDRLLALRPLIRYEPGYAVAGGLRFVDQRTLGRGSLVEGSVRAGARSFETTFSLEPPGALGLRLHLVYLRRNDAIYGGSHGDTRAELQAAGLAVVRYTRAAASAGISLRRRVARPLELEVGIGADNRVFDNGIGSADTPPIFSVYCTPSAAGQCVIDPALLPGFTEGISLLRAQGALRLDTRAEPRYGAGIYANLGASYAHGFARDPSRFATFTAGVGGVLGWGDRAFTLHVRGGMIEPFGAAPIPFDELLLASGPLAVRGLPRGRLRGPSDLLATLEYRWLLTVWMDAVLFVDRGNAFGPRFEGLSWQNTFTSTGLALMVMQARDVGYWRSLPLGGVQFAISADAGVRYSFSFALNTL